MTLELSLMSISGLGMIALLVHKHLENTRGIATRIQEARKKADPILQELHGITSKIMARFTVNNAIIFLNRVFVYVVRFFMNVSRRVHIISSNLVEKASKKTEDLSRSGAASFYLKQIKDAKESSDMASTDETVEEIQGSEDHPSEGSSF